MSGGFDTAADALGPGFEVICGEFEGAPALFVLAAIPDGAPSLVREGLARRRLSMLHGMCPCGGVRRPMNRAARRALARATTPQEAAEGPALAHAPECPAVAREVVAYLRGVA